MNFNFDSFKEFIESKGLYFDDQTLILLFSAISQRTPVMLRGAPGTGKTEVTKIIAEFLEAEYVFYQCTIGTTEDDLIYKILPSEDTKSGVKMIIGSLPEALKLSQKSRVVIVLDEFDKTRPSVDALLLDYLQNYRVSVRLGDDKVIIGNPENLWVFLTSNDERDFSEPLLRRLVSIKLRHLSPQKVREILLKNNVDEETADLLVQLYRDTINAGLRKPATIQELLQLAQAIKILGDRADWSSLVYSYVIKDDLEWQKYITFLESGRKMYESDYEDYENEDITDYYEDNETTEVDEDSEEFKPRMPKIKRTIEPVVTPKQENEEQTVSMVLEYSESNYNTVIKDFRPEPTDHPAIFEDFKVIKNDKETLIIKEKPLTFKEIVDYIRINNEIEPDVTLKKSVKSAKAYILGTLKLSEKAIQKLISAFTVLYYTKDLLRFASEYHGIDFVLQRVKRINEHVSEWKIEVISDHGYTSLQSLLNTLLQYTPEYVASIELEKTLKEKFKDYRYTVPDETWSVGAKKAFENSREYMELQSEIEEIKREISRKYGADPEKMFYKFSINLAYNNGNTEYVISRNRDTDSMEQMFKKAIEEWSVCQ